MIGESLLSHGAIPLYQHFVLRFHPGREANVPRNIARFMDYAASLILLRKVGGTYIFIHRYLLEYFADHDRSQAP